MMYLVEKNFTDKETKRLHKIGTVYIIDDEERVEELRSGGFLGVELIVKEELLGKKDEKSEKEPSGNKVEESFEGEFPNQENKGLPKVKTNEKKK